MNPRHNNWVSRRNEHRYYAEIVTDIKTGNYKRADM
jgi:hypothetical protein